MATHQKSMPKQIPATKFMDAGFRWITRFCAFAVGIVLLWIALRVGIEAMPAIQQFGFGFITNSTWNPIADQYGALPHIYGTLVSAAIALIIALPIGIGVAIFLSEDFLGDRAQQILIFLVELLAAIPSVVYGLWGIFVLVPGLRDLGIWLHQNLGAIAIFSTAPEGRGMYVAGVVLAIMILPIIAAISRESLSAVPVDLRQAALGLGATRWEAILKVILPAAASGIIGGTMLALGRALGETMAVTMLIGNSNQISPSVLGPASTIAALLANQFGEASGLQVSALMYAAFILFGLTLLVNILAELLVRKIKSGF